MAAIDITSLFADVLPNQQRQLDERTLQQSDAANQANAVGELGGMAAYLAPQRSRAMAAAGKGLLGIDTRTEAQKTMEQLKNANVDLSSREGLIKAANIYQSIDPIKAAQLRTQAAQVKAQEDKDARTLVEQQQQDVAFALGRANEVEGLTSKVTAREERVGTRSSLESLIDTSTILTDAEKEVQRSLVNQGAYDGKMSELVNVVDPKPTAFGNNILEKTIDGWQIRTAPSAVIKSNGLTATANLLLKVGTPEHTAALAAIKDGSLTKASDLDIYITPDPERGTIPSSVEKFNQTLVTQSAAASGVALEVDSLLELIETEFIDYGTAGLAAKVRSGALDILGKRDEIEKLRTAYTKTRNTEIINSLPPGVASDRDIQIFSAGFPPDGAGVLEIYEYLQSAQRAAFKIKDASSLLGRHLNDQVESGVDANTLDFQAAYEDFEIMRDRLDIMLKNAPNGRSEMDTQAHIEDVLQDFKGKYGFIPSALRVR